MHAIINPLLFLLLHKQLRATLLHFLSCALVGGARSRLSRPALPATAAPQPGEPATNQNGKL